MRKYSEELKTSAIWLVLNSKESTIKIAKNLELHEKILYAWMKKNKEHYSISIMSKVLKVDKSLDGIITEIFEEGRRKYGTRPIQSKLRKSYGIIILRKKMGKVMKRLDLVVKRKRKFKRKMDSKYNLPIAPNLLNRDFNSTVPNSKYVGDITYIHTKQGWSMDDNMKTPWVNNTLLMALQHRKPQKGLMMHTDRGSQYASHEHRNLCQEYGIIQSMSRKGNCWDNAVAESFFHTLKTELVYQITYETKAEANQSIFEFIEVHYNRKRMHSANNYLSSVDFEEKMLHKVKAA